MDITDAKSMKLDQDKQDVILIVDDTPTNLAVISETLTDAGFDVAIARSAERALEQIKLELPDLILLDIMMPGMSGFEFCQLLQVDPQFQQVPVIFMTASTDTASKVRGLTIGAVDYITKPFEEQEMVARIRTHLDLKKTRLKLQRSEDRLNCILNTIKEVVWSAYLDPFELLYLNPAAEELYGHSVDSFLGKPQLWLDMIYPDDQALVRDALTHAQPGQSLDLEYRILGPQSEIRWLHCQAEVRWHAETHRLRVDGVVRDISDRKEAEQKLQYSARFDSLTKVANRAYFNEYLTQLLQIPSQRCSDHSALLFVDLDRFKSINDSLGHAAGDAVLVHVSNILQKSTREGDFVARLGGDEFTILLNNLTGPDDASEVSKSILANLREPLLIQDQTLTITASIGIVANISQYNTVSELLHHADLAMYQAKRLGKACHQLFEPEIYEQALAKQTLEHDLKTAIQRQELELVYQPIQKLDSGKLKGFESLLRWSHPTKGIISPATFIPLAEETGLMIPLGEYLMQKACEQIASWQQDFPSLMPLTLSLNISGKQLQHPDFLRSLDHMLERYQLAPNCFEIEITESSMMAESGAALSQIQALCQRGFRLSLDDFGTGYSSLSYLHRFPIHTIKIDRSFVQTMEPRSSSFEIVRAILSLAQTLDLDVVAEGVETSEQIEVLKDLGCDMAQGNIYAEPMNYDDAWKYLSQVYSQELRVEAAL